MKRNGRPKTTDDQRPEPRPRKRAHLWQAYLIWDELVQMRKRHTLRLSSIEAGRSNMDADIEQGFIDGMMLDRQIEITKKTMINFGAGSTPKAWEFLTGIRGLKEGSLAAQLIAQIDDITGFTNVSKLWRYAGFAVFDGEREYNRTGEKSHYNRRLKSICFLIADQFIKQQTPVYVDIYYAEKTRLREMHPEPVPETRERSPFKQAWTDQHIHAMAMRKAVKILLQHLWVVWRESEGLPVTMPYVIDVMGHSDYLEPAMLDK